MSAVTAKSNWRHVTFISAGAGSGKTYRLTEELERTLLAGDAAPAGIIGTTFTVKAAAELRERVRDRLRQSGHTDLAERTAESLIGTVHSVCERLLRRFAFDIGVSPELSVMSIDDGERFFHQALDQTLELSRVRALNAISHRLGIYDRGVPLWQREVKTIADKARENDIRGDALAAMGARNAETLLGFFGEESNTDATADLVAAVERGLAMPKDDTEKTEEYRDKLLDAKTQLARGNCPWRIWMRLAGERGAKVSAAYSDAIQAAARRYRGHPAFHRDLRDFLQGIYQIAGAAMAGFQELKTEHGLIDFADMEQLVLHALDVPAVQQRLREELDLLLVDEFQDTNPMQLALFLKLAKLAKRAVFVGDAKQAIYEFRGCDPALVFNTLESLTAGEAKSTILPKSWRAQPPLLHYLNEVFATAFSPQVSAVGALPRDSVVLRAERPPSADPAVSAWRVPSNLGERCRAVADGVFRLVDQGERVADPVSGKERPIRYGDIAVLARTNKHVEEIAETLREMRVPMKMTLQGLLQTPEVTLAKSCLRRVADQADTLATAEILALADCAEAEDWLPQRLAWLAADENEDIVWREDDHPIVRRLAELRADSPLRSPVEIVARVLNEVDIRRIVAAWGPDDVRAAQRQKNLDALLNLAVEYEKQAAAHHDPGTLTGFLLWLEHPSSPDLDLQPVVTTGDAVHVLTYHRAKGLEWPLVVCTDFDYEPQLRTWDVRVELTGAFDIDAPLQGREVRYWPNIFDRRKHGVPERAAIEQSAEGVRCRERTLAEERRLAYVGLTRARDRLVLVLPEKPRKDAWLHSFLADFAKPSGDSLTLPNNVTIPTRAETILSGDGDGDREPLPYAPRWFPKRGRAAHPRKFLRPSDAPPVAAATIGEVLAFGERIPVRGDEMTDVGSGLHTVIAAELVNPLGGAEAVARAEEILTAWHINLRLDPADAVAAADRFRGFLRERFAPTALQVEAPVLHRLADARVVRGFADLLAETAYGWLIIDHKSSPQSKATWRKEALAYAGQLAAYRDALIAADRKVAGCWVHFAVTGALVEVKL